MRIFVNDLISEAAMQLFTTNNLLIAMVVALFLLGLTTTITGVIILITRATGRDIRTLAIQSTQLAQKGLAEEVVGLVGNASAILDSVNQLVRTAAGVGVFLTITGLVLIVASCWLALQIL
jgi:hypothetical protein